MKIYKNAKPIAVDLFFYLNYNTFIYGKGVDDIMIKSMTGFGRCELLRNARFP